MGRRTLAQQLWPARLEIAPDVRQRLARYYLDSGDSSRARAIYDDAFAAADTQQDRLAIVRAIADAHSADGIFTKGRRFGLSGESHGAVKDRS